MKEFQTLLAIKHATFTYRIEINYENEKMKKQNKREGTFGKNRMGSQGPTWAVVPRSE
jgi:hypothetical protein